MEPGRGAASASEWAYLGHVLGMALCREIHYHTKALKGWKLSFDLWEFKEGALRVYEEAMSGGSAVKIMKMCHLYNGLMGMITGHRPKTSSFLAL